MPESRQKNPTRVPDCAPYRDAEEATPPLGTGQDRGAGEPPYGMGPWVPLEVAPGAFPVPPPGGHLQDKPHDVKTSSQLAGVKRDVCGCCPRLRFLGIALPFLS